MQLLSVDADLVVHAAGPFQQAEKCTVLEAALKTKVIHWFGKIYTNFSMKWYMTFAMSFVFPQTAYIDVCDDTAYAFRAKSFHDRAVAANVPAITTGGIYPGVSNGLSIFSPSIFVIHKFGTLTAGAYIWFMFTIKLKKLIDQDEV